MQLLFLMFRTLINESLLICLSFFYLFKAILELNSAELYQWEFAASQFLFKPDQSLDDIFCHFDTQLFIIPVDLVMNCYNILLIWLRYKLDDNRRATVTTFGLKRVLHGLICITNRYGLIDSLLFYKAPILLLLDSYQWYFASSPVVFCNKKVVFSSYFLL